MSIRNISPLPEIMPQQASLYHLEKQKIALEQAYNNLKLEFNVAQTDSNYISLHKSGKTTCLTVPKTTSSPRKLSLQSHHSNNSNYTNSHSTPERFSNIHLETTDSLGLDVLGHDYLDNFGPRSTVTDEKKFRERILKNQINSQNNISNCSQEERKLKFRGQETFEKVGRYNKVASVPSFRFNENCSLGLGLLNIRNANNS